MDRISKHFKFAYARRNGVRKISKQNPHSLVDIFITKTLDYREYSGIFELRSDRIQRWYETSDSSVFIWFSWAHTTDSGTQAHVYTLSIFNFNFFYRKHRYFEQYFVCIKFTFVWTTLNFGLMQACLLLDYCSQVNRLQWNRLFQ